MSKKKAAEAKMAAKAAGLPIDDNFKEDVFELQHHHLLRCLEKTTVRHKVIFDPKYHRQVMIVADPTRIKSFVFIAKPASRLLYIMCE